jgi:hypothetical protein
MKQDIERKRATKETSKRKKGSDREKKERK